MWLPLTLLVLVGVVSAENDYGWKIGNEYTYHVQSRTLTSLDQFSTDYAGIVMKGLLTIQVKEKSKLTAKLWKGQYAHIHENQTEDYDSQAFDEMLDYRDLPISEKPFDIKLDKGLINSVIVENEVPSWEVVLMKSIITQLQLTTKGKNAQEKVDFQIPDVNESKGQFTVLEDYFAGLCEVHYLFNPLSEQQLQAMPELVPKPELKGEGKHIDIIKTKNYDKYPEMSQKVFGMTRQMKKEPQNSKKLMSKSSTTRIIISGNLNNFVIQSSTTTSTTTISPKFKDQHNSTVISKLNLTLENVNQFTNPMPSPKNPKSTGYRISFESTPSSLENAPKHPVWPRIIDYKGKFVGKSGEVDGLSAVKELVFEIANELENPNTIATENTLGKLTVLVNLIRAMNRDQIAEAENAMDISPKKLKRDDKAEAVKQNAWSAFRDAVTQSGTGPALLTIKNWIENGEVKGIEAADILSKMPATVRHITAEYTETFFELVISPQVTQTPFLNTTAVIAFSELLYQSHMNDKSIYKFYPAHTSSRLSPEQHSNIVTKYIPYLALQLKQAADDGDSPRIQTFIVALGNIGLPEAVRPFEPFLTGTEKLTDFQKTLMVASLSNFVVNDPKTAQEGLMDIYKNTTESSDVRCMAVFLLPMTNPSADVLRNIVDFSNNEDNEQVKSAVKSVLQAISDLRDPEWQPLAQNARDAKKLLNNTDDKTLDTHEFILNGMHDEDNIRSNMILNYIGSDNTVIPRIVYLAAILYNGNFKGIPVQFMGMISNFDSLLDALIPSGGQPLVKMATQKIAEELNIVGDKLGELEGNLMWKTKFMSLFVPFDENTIHNIPNKIAEHIARKKDGAYRNINILNLNEMIIGDTTDTGLPFVYDVRESTLQKLNSISNFEAGGIKSDLKLVGAQKVQKNIGFVTPFDHRHIVAGVDKYTQFYFPLKFSLEISAPQKSMQLKIWPLVSDETTWLVRRTLVPYTSIRNVMDIQPLLQQNGTKRLHVDMPKNLVVPVPNTRFKMMLEADESNEDIWVADSSRTWTMFPFSEALNMYHDMALIMDENRDVVKPLILAASYDTMDVEPGTEDTNQWTNYVSAVVPSDQKANSEQRKMQFLKEAAKGIKSAQSGVLDLQLQVPDGQEQLRINAIIAGAMSNVETKARLLLHLRVEDPLDVVQFEFCGGSQIELTPSYFPGYDEIINATPKVEFDVDVRYGKNCPESSRINIRGRATRSEELKEEIEKTDVVKKCKEQMKQGNKLLRVCQNAAWKAMHMDDFEVSIKSGSPDISTAAEEGITSFVASGYISEPVNISQPTASDSDGQDKIIKIKAKISKDLKSANLSMNSPNVNMEMNDVSLDVLNDSSEEVEEDDEWGIPNDAATCVMDVNIAETFDGKEFPLKLTSCWHVLTTTYPRPNPKNPSENLAMLEEDSVSILAREVNGQREVKVILGRNEILLLPGGQLPEVLVNGQKVTVSSTVSHQVRQDDEVAFEIFQSGNDYVSVVSDFFDVDLTYDGKRILIDESDMLSNSVRGICGNYDGMVENDFMGPGNCLLKLPREFIASYTLTKDQCEGQNLQDIKSLQMAPCNKIPSRLAPKSKDPKNSHKYSILIKLVDIVGTYFGI